MSYIKKRVPRKPGATPQEIIADQKTLANWFRENANFVVYTAGTVLFILVIILGVVWMKGEKRESANSALSRAMATYQTTVAQMPEGSEAETENLEMALENLEDVAAEYSDVPQGQTAALFKANVLFRLGRFQEAADTIVDIERRNREFLKDINAYYLLARCYEAMKDYGSAIEAYRTSRVNARGDMLGVIDIDLARCHELMGDLDTAISILRDIVEQYPDTVFATRAGKKLAVLGVAEQETP